MRRSSFILLLILSVACSRQAFFQKELVKTENDFQNHVGFILYDPVNRETLIDHNSSRYFTPASNTKIFTFYTALQILGDSIPGLKYVIRNDSLIFWGTGDPSLLNPKIYANDRVVNFLQSADYPLYMAPSKSDVEPLGPGWAWDDFTYRFSAERSAFPIYGNYLTAILTPDDSLAIQPASFASGITRASEQEEHELKREPGSNTFTFYPGAKKMHDTLEVAFKYSSDVFIQLLSDTIHKSIGSMEEVLQEESPTIVYSIPADSMYRVMMQDSDNFIAEQLLLLCAGTISDTLKTEIAIDYALQNFFFDLPDKPKWVDGSGLSRYNLFTPRSIVRVWEKIYLLIPEDRLYHLIATGGKNGTIENYFKSDPPYLFGKTGTLSNNHSLSGFIKTKKGKTLIFCWMNNNYTTSSVEVRKRMESVLLAIRDKF